MLRFQSTRRVPSGISIASFTILTVLATSFTANAQDEVPLPRIREGGTPYDATQSIVPFSVRPLPPPPSMPAVASVVASPAEYEPARGVLFRYNSASFATVVRDCVVALTADPAHDEIAYVVVSSAAQQTSAANAFSAAGADMSKVQFILQPSDSVWLRDYGPHFVWQGGALAIVDSHYYPTRPNDNFVPTLIGDDVFGMPTYDMGLYYSGGNFQPGPNRSGFCTALVNVDNPAGAGFDAASISELYAKYQGIDVLHVLPQLPTTVDGTGHIDMWMYLLDADDVVISQFQAGSNATAISITNNAVPFMQGLGFTVHRTPAWNVGTTHYTYANAFRVNDRIFIPSYGQGDANYLDEDAAAVAAYQAALGPGVQVVPINCYSIIPASGAIHCIVMQVPRYTASVPAAYVTAPKGGEILVPGQTTTITWLASDTNNVPLAGADLSWSPDDGTTWFPIASVPSTGSYVWTVPATVTDRARVRVVVTATDSDTAVAQSVGSFRIEPGTRNVYDFATGAGTTRFAYGTISSSWTAVNSVRRPVNTQVSTSAYAAMATSNATGGDTDTNRYISPTVTTGNESTHVFEVSISEDPNVVDAIEVSWEGYADQCTQAELYVWDYVANQWSDGRGLVGQNRYLDSFAGNRDGRLSGTIESNFPRYVGPGGQMTFLAYAERSSDETYHDYVSVTVTTVGDTGSVFCAGDGSGTVCPCGNAGLAGRGCANSSTSDGARLALYGVADVSSDTLSLAASGMPSGAIVLFIQGSAQQNGGNGIVFGDGLRCMAGSVVRLGVANAPGGVASFGSTAGTDPVSLRGGISPTGGTFSYQAWYRDSAAFCSSSTFNLTNGVSVNWLP